MPNSNAAGVFAKKVLVDAELLAALCGLIPLLRREKFINTPT